MAKARFNFTKKFLSDYPCPEKGRIRIWDQKCSFLCLQITSTNKKAFYLYRYDPSTKQPIQKRIGSFPDTTIELARDAATKTLVQIAEGKLTGKKYIPTLLESLNTYIENRNFKLTKNTIESYRSMVRIHLSKWHSRNLDTITRQDVVSKFLSLSLKSESTANRTFRLLRAIYNEQADLLNDDMTGKVILGNPVTILTKRKFWHKEKPATDWIEPDKLELFFETINTMRKFDTFYDLVADYLEFLLLTGLRRREASLLRIENVNLSELIYKITPKMHEETLMPMTVYLSELLKKRILISKTAASDFVFANIENDGEAINDPRRVLAYIRQELGIDITIHGFRRSFATYAESIDLSQYVIKRLLNHSMGRDVTGVHYIQRDMGRLRTALSRIESTLLSLGRKAIKPKSERPPETPRQVYRLVNTQ